MGRYCVVIHLGRGVPSQESLMAARKSEKSCELLLAVGPDDTEVCVDAMAALLPSATQVESVRIQGERFLRFLVTQEIANALETLFPMYFKSTLQVSRVRQPRRLIKKAS